MTGWLQKEKLNSVKLGERDLAKTEFSPPYSVDSVVYRMSRPDQLQREDRRRSSYSEVVDARLLASLNLGR